MEEASEYIDPVTWKDWLYLLKLNLRRIQRHIAFPLPATCSVGDVCAHALEDCTRSSAALFMIATIRKQQARSPPEDWDTLTRRNTASAEKEQMTVTHRGGWLTSVMWSSGRSQTQRGLGFLFHLHQVQKQANLTCGLGSQAPRGQED